MRRWWYGSASSKQGWVGGLCVLATSEVTAAREAARYVKDPLVVSFIPLPKGEVPPPELQYRLVLIKDVIERLAAVEELEDIKL